MDGSKLNIKIAQISLPAAQEEVDAFFCSICHFSSYSDQSKRNEDTEYNIMNSNKLNKSY